MTVINLVKERAYAKLALNHCRVRRKTLEPGAELVLPVIKPGTPEWTVWQQYFNSHLGFMPYAMQRVEHGMGSGEFTVPCERPEEFDGSYKPNKALSFENVRRLYQPGEQP